MLTLCLSTDRKVNTAHLLDEICGNHVQGQILLVPEQFSHMAERNLCRRGGDQITLYAEVLSFSRLASRVFSCEGGSAETETDTVGKLLIMSLAVEQVRSRLKIYGKSAGKPAFLMKLLDTLEELRSYCATADSLREASGRAEGALAVKLEEFALLMESYDSVCSQMGQNPETRLTRLLHALDGSDYPEDKHFYIDGFTDFNGVELEIISALLNGGAEVNVALQCDGLHGGAQQFEAARGVAGQLLRKAASTGTETRVLQLKPKGQSVLTELRTKMFGGALTPYEEKTDRICFLEGQSIQEECRMAAGEILKLTAEGARFRDITVACADEAEYAPVLETVFRRAEIPAYFAGDRDILHQGVIHMLLSVLEAVTEGMETESVLSYIKSGYLPVERERCDRLENYILMWNIRGSLWEKEWTMNPYGFQKKLDEKGKKLLQELNEDRELLIVPLIRLRNSLRSAQNTAQMVLAFYDFTEKISLREQLNEIAKDQYREGNLRQAQEYAQIFSVFSTVLEQMYGVLGTSVRGPEDFYHILEAALSQASIGTIPASLDCVSVGSLMAQRRCDTDYLFLLGVNEGFLPAAQTNETLLTDLERESLVDLGVGVSPAGAGRLDRELAAIAAILDGPEKCLYLGATAEKEAYYCRRARTLFPKARMILDDRELIVRSGRDYLSFLISNQSGIEEANPVKKEADRILSARSYSVGSLSRGAVENLYGKTLRLSSSKIDKLAGCRFAYFLQYGLRAKERETAQMDSSLYGTFVHDVLEHTGKRTMEEGGFHKVPQERVLEIAEEEMERYTRENLADLWESTRAEYLFRRTFDEVRTVIRRLWEELSASEFEPGWFELEFRDRGKLPGIRIVGKEMTGELEGIVDRGDLWRQDGKIYVRIIDYKTGKKKFDFNKILNGLGLQMLLYLFALCRETNLLPGEKLSPAGVLYFPARVEPIHLQERPDEQAEKKRLETQRRSGLLLNEDKVLQAMEPGEKPVLLPGKNSLASEHQLKALENFVFQTVAALIDQVSQGDVSPNPYFADARDNACAYCPYTAICRDRPQKRWLKKVKDVNEFWEKVEGGSTDG